MFNFLKLKKKVTSDNSEASEVGEQLARQESRHYSPKLDDFAAGKIYLKAEPQFQREMVLAMIAWFDRNVLRPFQQGESRHDWNVEWQTYWKMRELLLSMLKRKLPFSEQDVIALLQWSMSRTHSYHSGIPQMIKVLGDYLKENELTNALRRSTGKLIDGIESGNLNVCIKAKIGQYLVREDFSMYNNARNRVLA